MSLETLLRLGPGALALVALLLAAPATAGKIRVTPTVKKAGMRNDLPAPQQSEVKVRDVATGVVVARGTVPGAGDSGQFRTGEIVVPPGKYDVEVHMREGTSHYKDVQRVEVGPGKATAGVTPQLDRMSNQEIREHQAQDRIDRLDRAIAKTDQEIKELAALRDRAQELGNEETAQQAQSNLEAAEAKKAGQEETRAHRQAKLDEMQGKKDPRKAAQDNVRRSATTAGKVHVDPKTKGPNVPTNQSLPGY